MNIPIITHKKVTYRNGQHGKLLLTDRKDTAFRILSLRNKNDSLIHHLANGKCFLSQEDSEWDIVEVEE